MEEKKWVQLGDWQNNTEIEFVNKMYLLTAKPVIYLVNLSEADFLKKKNKWLLKIKEWVEGNLPGVIIPYSADYERNLLVDVLKNQEESKEQAPIPSTSMLAKIIKTGYKTLDLINFFTCGEDEVRAWTIKDGWKAP